jgi:hypothetical protein
LLLIDAEHLSKMEPRDRLRAIPMSSQENQIITHCDQETMKRICR